MFYKKTTPTIPESHHKLKRNKFFPVRQIELYCVCNMPETYGDMIECGECCTWFHIKCMTRLQSIPETWYCPTCSTSLPVTEP